MFCDQRYNTIQYKHLKRLNLEASLLRFATSETKCVSNFTWTGDEVKLLLREANEYEVAERSENVDWEFLYQTILGLHRHAIEK